MKYSPKSQLHEKDIAKPIDEAKNLAVKNSLQESVSKMFDGKIIL